MQKNQKKTSLSTEKPVLQCYSRKNAMLNDAQTAEIRPSAESLRRLLRMRAAMEEQLRLLEPATRNWLYHARAYARNFDAAEAGLRAHPLFGEMWSADTAADLRTTAIDGRPCAVTVFELDCLDLATVTEETTNKNEVTQ